MGAAQALANNWNRDADTLEKTNPDTALREALVAVMRQSAEDLRAILPDPSPEGE